MRIVLTTKDGTVRALENVTFVVIEDSIVIWTKHKRDTPTRFEFKQCDLMQVYFYDAKETEKSKR